MCIYMHLRPRYKRERRADTSHDKNVSFIYMFMCFDLFNYRCGVEQGKNEG